MGRYLIVLDSADQPSFLQVAQSRGQHGIGDSGDGLFQLPESKGLIPPKLKEHPGIPFTLKYLHGFVDWAVQDFFRRHFYCFFHGALLQAV